MSQPQETVIIHSLSDLRSFSRCLHSLLTRGGLTCKPIVIDHRKETATYLKRYGSLCYWKLLQTNEPTTDIEIATDYITESAFILRGDCIVWNDALKYLAEKDMHIVADAYLISKHILEFLDGYADNLTQPMVDYCVKNHPEDTAEYHPNLGQYLYRGKISDFKEISTVAEINRDPRAIVLVQDKEPRPVLNGPVEIVEVFSNEHKST